MAERKYISKKLRFEVFKRDNFTCQYCGRMAPDVILQVDHIKPVKEGGTNDILNLVTSCVDCNLGKGAKLLSDDSAVKKQQTQLKLLGEKREQLEMVLQWKNELLQMQDKEVNTIVQYVEDKTKILFNPAGKEFIRKIIKKYGFSEAYDSTVIAVSNYFTSPDSESFNRAVEYIDRICANRLQQKENPMLIHINYIIKIIKNMYPNTNPYPIKRFLKEHLKKEEDVQYIKSFLYKTENIYFFKDKLLEYYGEEIM